MTVAQDNLEQPPNEGGLPMTQPQEAYEQLTPPTQVPFAKHSAQAIAEGIGKQLNSLQAPPEQRDEAYTAAFQDATKRLLGTYAVIGSEDASEFEAAYRYAEAEDGDLGSERRGDLFDAYEEHPAMLAIDGLDKVLNTSLKERTPHNAAGHAAFT